MPRFITKKWVEVHDQSRKSYSINKQIRFKASTFRSDLCDYSDAYIVVKRTISVARDDNKDMMIKNRSLAFKISASFISCISKINNILIDNAEDLDVAMPMYNLIEYSKSYRKTTGSLCNYYGDELSDDTNDDNNLNKKVIESESFKYTTSITRSTYNDDGKINDADGNEADNAAFNPNKVGTKEPEVVVPLKHLSNFWITLDIPLINCEINLILTWSEDCVITSMKKRVTAK